MSRISLLLEEIERIRSVLNDMIAIASSLTDAQIVNVSKQLDEMLNMYNREFTESNTDYNVYN